MDYVTLNNGVKMPQLGYGVYQTPPEETERCVLAAIKNGYRSLDTAQAYGRRRRRSGNCKMQPAKRGTFHYHKDLDQQCRI